MGRDSIEFQKTTFSYETQSDLLIRELTLQLYPGWTGVVGANGVGKSTIMKLATGLLEPSSGNVLIPGDALYCQQRTDDPPELFRSLIESQEHDACVLKGQLHIEEDWLNRWDSLSHGERKRSQIGTALWQKPSVLAIDEPTNHLDKEGRDILFRALKFYNGVGLLVSHDRSLLDTLCDACLFIDPPDIDIRSGRFSRVWNQIQADRESAQKKHLQANREFKKLDREVKKRRNEASKADSKRSKKGVGKKDSDARAKINLARLSGKDAVAGKLMNQLEGRRRQAEKKLNGISVKKTYETGIWQQGEVARKDLLFSIKEGSLKLGENQTLHFPELNMKPNDRIAITGLNGTGKSTLLHHLMEQVSVDSTRLTYIPQEIDASKSVSILQEVQSLSSEKLGKMMTVINRLGTRPPRLLESEEPSPGEVRKIMLAIGVAHVPHLIVMDEPTNHLDLLSIECLEETLADYPAGLLLISHDEAFLSGLVTTEWHIKKVDAQNHQLEIRWM